MTDADLIQEIERRAASACPMRGPDYRAILSDVAEEAKVPLSHLEAIWVDATITGPI
jgi:hypothetical protein